MRISDWSSDVCSSDLPLWLRVRKPNPREIWPLLLVVLPGALLIWQCVRLLCTLLTPLSPLGAWQPQTAVIASPAERRELFTSLHPFFRGNAHGRASCRERCVQSVKISWVAVALKQKN